MNEILLECRKITKNFGQTHALTDVDIVFRRGEIHGLIGENGSGKSTLTSIISGLIPPTSGEMVLEGKPWKPQSSLAGYKNGVRIVVQEASTVPAVTVAENIFMGDETLFAKGPFINRAKLNAAAKSIGMAYSKAWRIIKETEAALEIQLLNRDGAHGSSLTDEGNKLLDSYLEIAKRVQEAAEKEFHRLVD